MALLSTTYPISHLLESLDCNFSLPWNVSSTEALDQGQFLTSCNFSLEDFGYLLPNETFSNKTWPAQNNYSDPTYYSRNYRIIGTIFQGIIFVVGVLGNVMVVLVVKQSNSMQSPTNCYLVSLAIADCVVLWVAVPNEILGYYILGDEWIWGHAGCALFVFCQYLGINASALSITAFTVERYIAICHPMKAQTVCTVQRAKRIILGVWIFATIYCAPWLVLTKTSPIYYKGFNNKERCTFALDRGQYLGYFFADLIVFYVVPLLLSCVLYGLIARILVISNQLRSTPRCSSDAANDKANGFCHSNSRKSTATAARVQVVKMLVVVVLLFAILWMPYRVVVVYNSFASTPYMDPYFLMFSKTLIYMNSAINPILYNALSIKFRRAFRRMLLCGEPDSSSYFESERSMVTIRFRTTCSNSPGGNRTTTLGPPSPTLEQSSPPLSSVGLSA